MALICRLYWYWEKLNNQRKYLIIIERPELENEDQEKYKNIIL